MLLVNGFATVSQIVNHCQMPCFIKKLRYSGINVVMSQDYVINFNDSWKW